MRILITNHRLDVRAGTESFTRDLARGLQSLGHSVLAFSSDPDQRQRFLENDFIPVATALERLPVPPDVIHAQHPLDAMTALLALPGVPAVYHCHGHVLRPSPPRHPRIYRYLAASKPMAERIMVESGIAPSDVSVFPEGVDAGRFCKLRRLPVKPARALFFGSRHHIESGAVSAIREAAARCELEFDLLDSDSENSIERPERILPTYDIVFASGISAIEAIACGCAVVVVDGKCCGEMIDAKNFDRYRQADFSIPSHSVPSPVEAFITEIRRFSADRSAEVCERLRREADLRASIGELVEIYAQVIERHRQSQPDMRAEMLAASRYLREITPLIRNTDKRLDEDSSSATRACSFNDLRARLVLIEQRIRDSATG